MSNENAIIDEASGFKRLQPSPERASRPKLVTLSAKELDRMRIETYGKTFNEKLAEGLIDKDGNSLVSETKSDVTSETRRVPPGRENAPKFISYSREELDRMRIETYGYTANELREQALREKTESPGATPESVS